MKTLITVCAINYIVLGFAHALFVTLLAKNPTARLVITELLLWPRRTWHGIKAIRRDMGKLDI